MAITPASVKRVPKPISVMDVPTTNARDRPFAASHAIRPPRQPIIAPAVPPIRPAVRSDHHALAPPFCISMRLPGYSTSLTGPTQTVPRPGRNTLISNLVGGPLAPVRSNGGMNHRHLD